jgi:hypothetical protein
MVEHAVVGIRPLVGGALNSTEVLNMIGYEWKDNEAMVLFTMKSTTTTRLTIKKVKCTHPRQKFLGVIDGYHVHECSRCRTRVAILKKS